ncbi:hypothetical protein K0H71_17105 [Bacillus sp. IITD106]|nr:hypothetical protein [Bacillus sp. IITD106]
MNFEHVREALIEWETLSANKENRVLFEARAKELRDLLSNLEGERRLGREEGRKESMIKERHNVALKMLQEGMEPSIVMKVTGLSEDVIRKLTTEIN